MFFPWGYLCVQMVDLVSVNGPMLCVQSPLALSVIGGPLLTTLYQLAWQHPQWLVKPHERKKWGLEWEGKKVLRLCTHNLVLMPFSLASLKTGLLVPFASFLHIVSCLQWLPFPFILTFQTCMTWEWRWTRVSHSRDSCSSNPNNDIMETLCPLDFTYTFSFNLLYQLRNLLKIVQIVSGGVKNWI